MKQRWVREWGQLQTLMSSPNGPCLPIRLHLPKCLQPHKTAPTTADQMFNQTQSVVRNSPYSNETVFTLLWASRSAKCFLTFNLESCQPSLLQIFSLFFVFLSSHLVIFLHVCDIFYNHLTVWGWGFCCIFFFLVFYALHLSLSRFYWFGFTTFFFSSI